MQTPSSASHDAPDIQRFVERLLKERGDDVEFVVLFGSRPRGDWSPDSDFDVLVGLAGEEGQRLIDRIYDFSLLANGNLEVFPYARSEWQRMFEGRNLLFLESLGHGQILFDRGAFATMR